MCVKTDDYFKYTIGSPQADIPRLALSLPLSVPILSLSYAAGGGASGLTAGGDQSSGAGQQQIPGEGAAFLSNKGKGRSGGSQGATPGEQIRPPPSSTTAQREETPSPDIQQRQIFSKSFHHLLAKEVGRAVTTGVFAVGLLAVLPSLVLSGTIPARSAVPLALFSYNIASMLFGVLCKLAIAFFQSVLGGVPVLTFESVPSKGKMGLSPSHQHGAPALAVPLSLSVATAAASGIGASLFQHSRK